MFSSQQIVLGVFLCVCPSHETVLRCVHYVCVLEGNRAYLCLFVFLGNKPFLGVSVICCSSHETVLRVCPYVFPTLNRS